MGYTEPLLLSARHTTQTSPRHLLHIARRSRHAATTPTNTDTDGHMVVAVQDDETGSLVAADGDDDAAVAGADDDDAPVVRSARGAWEVFTAESRRLWAIGAPIAFNVICLYGTNSTTQIFVGHIGDRELSAVAIGLSVVSNFSFGFLLGMGSALETLCGQAFGAGQVAMLGIYMQRLDHPRRLRRAALAALRLLGAHPAAARPGGEHRRRRRGVHAADHPADVRARHQLPHAEVPPGAEQGDGAGVDRVRGAPRARGPPRALRLRARLGHRRRRRGVRRVVLADGAGAGGLRGRVVPRWVDGAVPRGVQRALGLRQALARLGRHAVPRDMVHDGARRAHRTPRRRRDRRRLRIHLHEHKRMGGDAVHRAERGHQRAGVERARVGAAEGDDARGGGGAGAVAGVRAAGDGAHPGHAEPLRRHLHRRQAPAEGGGQHRLPARRHHGAQQHPARHLRCGGRRRMAGSGGVHQSGLLLRLRPPSRLHLWLPLQMGRAGHLGWHAVRDGNADGHPHVHGLQNRLGRRGGASVGEGEIMGWAAGAREASDVRAGGDDHLDSHASIVFVSTAVAV